MPAVRRTDETLILKNHEDRIAALERAPLAPGVLRFNTDNEGGWLYVVANDSVDIGYGENAILFADTNGAGILLVSGGSRLDITPAEVDLASGGALSIGSAAGDVNVAAVGGNLFLNLPTSDPGVSGALWNNAGVVTVSP